MLKTQNANNVKILNNVSIQKCRKLVELLTHVEKISAFLIDLHHNDATNARQTADQIVRNINAKEIVSNSGRNCSISELFFTDIYPMFERIMSSFVYMNNYTVNSKDNVEKLPVLSILNIPFLVKLTTRNMILYFTILQKYRNFFCNMLKTLKNNYLKEVNTFFEKIQLADVFTHVDKQVNLNMAIQLKKNDTNDLCVVNLHRVFENVYTYILKSIESDGFKEIVSSIHTFSKSISKFVDPKTILKREKREIFEISDMLKAMSFVTDDMVGTNLFMSSEDIFSTNKDCRTNYNINFQDKLFGMGRRRRRDDSISSDSYSDDAEDDLPKRQTRKKRRTTIYEDDNIDKDSDDDDDDDDVVGKNLFKSNYNNLIKMVNNDENGPIDSKTSDMMCQSFLTIKDKLNEIDDAYNRTNDSKYLNEWYFEVNEIYNKFGDIFDAIMADAENVSEDLPFGVRTGQDFVKLYDEETRKTLRNLYSLDKNVNVATMYILNAIPFQAKMFELIQSLSVQVTQYMTEISEINTLVSGHSNIITSITKLSMNSVIGTNIIFPHINFIPDFFIDHYMSFVLETDLKSIIQSYTSQLLSDSMFLSISGLILSPIEVLVLEAAKNDKLHNNTHIISQILNEKNSCFDMFMTFLKVLINELSKQKILIATVPQLNKNFLNLAYKNKNSTSQTQKDKILETLKSSFSFSSSFMSSTSSSASSSASAWADKFTTNVEYSNKDNIVATGGLTHDDVYVNGITLMNSYAKNKKEMSPSLKQSLFVFQSFFFSVEPIFVIMCSQNNLKCYELLKDLLKLSYTYAVNSIDLNGAVDRKKDPDNYPKCVENMLLRFAFFYIFFFDIDNTSVDVMSDKDVINLRMKNSSKLELIESINKYVNINSKLVANNIELKLVTAPVKKITLKIPLKYPYDHKKSSLNSYTVDEDYYTKLNDLTEDYPDIANFLKPTFDSTTSTNCFDTSNFSIDTIFETPRNLPTTSFQEICELFQFLPKQLFAGILCQKVTSSSSDYTKFKIEIRNIAQSYVEIEIID